MDDVRSREDRLREGERHAEELAESERAIDLDRGLHGRVRGACRQVWGSQLAEQGRATGRDGSRRALFSPTRALGNTHRFGFDCVASRRSRDPVSGADGRQQAGQAVDVVRCRESNSVEEAVRAEFHREGGSRSVS